MWSTLTPASQHHALHPAAMGRRTSLVPDGGTPKPASCALQEKQEDARCAMQLVQSKI